MSSLSRRKASSSAGSRQPDNASARDDIPPSAGQLRDVSAKMDTLARKTPEPHTEQLDDLAALFMPEILNHRQQLSLLVPQPLGQGIKEEDFGYEYFQDAIEPMQPPHSSWNHMSSAVTAPGKSSLYYSQHPCQPGGLQNQANLHALDYPPVPVSHQNAPTRGNASNYQRPPNFSNLLEHKSAATQEPVENHSVLSLLTQPQQYQLQLQRLQQHESYSDRRSDRRLHHINELHDPQQAFRDTQVFNSQSSSSARYDGSSQAIHQHPTNNLAHTNIANVPSAYQPPQYNPQNPYYVHTQRHPQDTKQPASHYANYDLSVDQLGAAYNRYSPRNYDNALAASFGSGTEQANWVGLNLGSAPDPTRQEFSSIQTPPIATFRSGSGDVPQSGQSMFDDNRHHGPNLSFKKAKSLKPKSTGIKFDFDYAPAKLTRLLDFKKVPSLDNALVITPGDYSIIDSNSNPVQVTLNGFLNGRFLTNDIDNNKYIRSRLEQKNLNSDQPRQDEKSTDDDGTTTHGSIGEYRGRNQDARVISCYRRNFIQISLNLKITGYTSDSKLLRLKSSELGYTITRVIKFLKVEILASTNAPTLRSVPVIILNESAKDEKDKKRQGRSFGERKEDGVNPSPVASTEMVVLLNDECEIENGEVNKYFVVKKLQFKSATPNNGNLTFQNYYHLRLKLIAVVADLYYNDPVSEVRNDGNLENSFALDKNNHQDGCGGDDAEMDNNEVTLYEVVSEPIIVRGRNPNFYTDRNNILIDGRSCSSKASFQIASEAPPSTCGYAESPETRAADAPFNSQPLETANDDAEPTSPLHRPDPYMDDSNGTLESSKEPPEKESLGEEKMDSVDEDDRSNLAGGSWSEQNSQLSPMEFADARQKSPLENVNGYKYFPVSNVYYLPPINVVYFPHGAHLLEIVKSRKDLAVSDQKSNSNVYFK